MHRGFETSAVWVAEKSHRWLRRSIQDSRAVTALPALRLHHLGSWNNMTFLIHILSSVFSKVPYVGALWWFSSPRVLVSKGLGNSPPVLYFGFLFAVVSIDWLICPQEEWPKHGKGFKPPPPGQVTWGLLPSAIVKGRGAWYLGIFRDFVFLWCLSNGSSHS